MGGVRILYFGKNKDILETVIRLLNNHESWSGEGVYELEHVKESLRDEQFDILLLGCGIEESDELELRNYMKEHYPSVKIIQHYGGGSGLLSNEILEALHTDGTSLN
jgi:DNA-binding NtrC family response regulator